MRDGPGAHPPTARRSLGWVPRKMSEMIHSLKSKSGRTGYRMLVVGGSTHPKKKIILCYTFFDIEEIRLAMSCRATWGDTHTEEKHTNKIWKIFVS